MSSSAAQVDVSGRPLALRDVDLDAFLHPRTVAVIGASENMRKPNGAMTRKFKTWSEKHGADFFPVHPEHDDIYGSKVYRSIFDVPGDIDLAIILTGAAVDTFEEVLQRKAKFAVIFAAGFSETGAEGEALESRLGSLVHGGEVRLLGPNTNLNAFEDFRDDLDGPSIALITQSGHQGRPVFQGQEIGIRLTHWAPTGNEVDLEFADFARYFADRPEVGVIAAYIEGFKDGRTLMLAADHCARLKKPMVVVKVGRTDEGEAMAKAHTGHLTGADEVISAVFRQFGVTRVDGLDELLDTAAAFARTTPVDGGLPRWLRGGRSSAKGAQRARTSGERASATREPGVAIYAISGGTGAHMADMAAGAGLRLPELTKETQSALHDGLIPKYLRVSNPIDCGGPPVMTPAGRTILELILADPNVDILVCPITGALETMSMPLVRDLVDVAQTTDKPIHVIWGSPVGTEAAYRDLLLGSQLPVFRTFHNCVQAIKAYIDYWSFAARYRSPFDDAPMTPLPAAKRARAILHAAAPGEALSEHTSKQLLKAYGIKSSREVLCESAAAAVRAAQSLKFPVVMKVSSPDLLHKSDLGLVEVGVDSVKGVRAAYETMLRKARRAGGRNVRIDGVIVSELVTGGVETVVGVSQDPLFGPVVMVGLGGIFVEVLEDVTFRVPPFDGDEVHRMLRELKGYPLLTGVRGRKPVDVDALVDVVMKVQRLSVDLAGEVAELDINPLVVRPRGAVALDALVVRK
jgi:acyl-CoA synthetase (NDP forming)